MLAGKQLPDPSRSPDGKFNGHGSGGHPRAAPDFIKLTYVS